MRKCGHCGMTFRFHKDLLEHRQKIHGGPRNHMCAECGRSFASRSSLKTHTDNAHDNHEMFCDACGKTYKNKALLKSHVKKMHSVSYTCEHCGKVCFYRFYRKRHKTFRGCRQRCPYAF